MKVGSLVVCIDNTEYHKYDMIEPDKEKIYTVSVFIPANTYVAKGVRIDEDGIYLAEIKNGIMAIINAEPAYRAKDFREVLPPMQKEIEELLKQPEYATI